MKTRQNREQNQVNPEHAGRKRICILLGALLLLLGLSFLPGNPVLVEAGADTEVTKNDTSWNNDTVYVVRGKVTIRNRVTVEGNVTLLLCDGAFLKADKGITVNEGNTLSICSEEAGTGQLKIGLAEMYCAGIGGEEYYSCGNIIINGGIIDVEGGTYAAGIGGGRNGSGGMIEINGGIIDAESGHSAAGIGGGVNGEGGTITINGGTVTSSGNYGGAGLGGGDKGAGGCICIYGGTVNARGTTGAGIGGGSNGAGGTIDIDDGIIVAKSSTGAGIGSGYRGTGGKIDVSDGNVTASSSKGAGIGSGNEGADVDISISGGKITATGNLGAGIGSGKSGTGSEIYIDDGEITATGEEGAGIGGGEESIGGIITIEGGTIKASSHKTTDSGAGIGSGLKGTGWEININGGKITANGGKTGAGIGGGSNGAGGTIILSGGTISATAGSFGGEAVGCGKDPSDAGALMILDMKVKGGENQASAADAGAYEIDAFCRKSYAELVPCEAHEYQDGICRFCAAIDELPPIAYSGANGEEQSCGNWVPVTGSQASWNNNWYAVTTDVTVNSRINIAGDVNLILCDGATLYAVPGIHVPEGAKLTIWAQHGGTGSLMITDIQTYHAGIGGNINEACGEVIIRGGNIRIKGKPGAGIGGGYRGSGGNITIYGGNIILSSGDGACIGGGYRGSGGNITIYGGNIITSSGNGAGIGGGYKGSGGNITIHDGIITTASRDGAGIGGGWEGDAGTIKLLGGRITTSSQYGYSIGPGIDYNKSSMDGAPGPITLSWSSPTDYINAATIVASSYTLNQPFLYSRNGETVGKVTAENLPAKEAGDILVPNTKADAGLSITDGDLNMVAGEEVTLQTNVTAAGENGQWTWSSDTTAAATVDKNGKITAIAEGAAKITAIYESDTTWGEAAVTVTVIKAHSVHINATEHGTIQADPETALPGTTVTLTLTPETGYRFGTLLVTGGSEDVPVARKTEGDDSEWTFMMPDTDAYVSASFSEPNTYTASFFNFNGEYMENLQQSAYTEGTTPQYNGEEPERQATEQYTYTFSGWNPAPGPIEQDTDYFATYTETLRNYPVTFKNWDETVLQSSDAAYGATPAYTGQTPEGPEDEQWVYHFSGWTPKIVPVTGAAVYTAEYERMQRLKPGANTVSLQEYETVSCSFIPDNDSYYRFTSGVCEAQPIIRIYDKDGEDPIARDVYWSGGNYTFDCLAELTGGQEYRIEIMSINGSAELTVNVAQAEVYGITVDPDIENGVIFECPDEAYVGRLVVVGAEAAEGYMLEELVVTDAEGHEIDTERDMFTMPASPVTVSARFTPVIPIILDLEEPVSVTRYGISVENLMTFPEEDDSGNLYVGALEGFEIEMSFECRQDGVEVGSVTVTGADGTDVYWSVWQEDDSSMPVYRFIMPAVPVLVQVRVAQEYPEFGNADFILPEDTETVEESAFEGDLAITSAEIPYGCERIGNYAFRNCTNLNKIRIPYFCEIGTDAFDGCTLVYIYGEAGSPADLYCRLHDNCVFVEE